jgi:hypothetical protein
MLLELELLLQRQGADGSFDTASLAPTTAGISLMVTQSASADREPGSRSTGTGIIRPGKTIRRTGVREANGTRAANGNVRQRLTFRRSGAARRCPQAREIARQKAPSFERRKEALTVRVMRALQVTASPQ